MTNAGHTRGLTDRQWIVRGALGIAGYIALALLPVVLMLLPPRPEPRTFLREFSVALAFSGLALLGLQLLLSGRFRRLKAPYGVDAVYHFHRGVSIPAFAFIALHPVLLVIDDSSTLALFNVFSAPWRARFAVTALVLAGVILALSFLRQRVGLGYELWRRTHGLLAIAMLAAAVAHIELVGYYVSTPLKRELWVVYPVAWVLVLAWTRIVKPAVMLRHPWRVDQVRPERGNAWTLRLVPEDGAMRFDPGQFVWLNLRHSPFAMSEHPFSMSSSAEKTDAVEITIKELGDWTSTIGTVKPGETAWLDGPYGQFSVDRHRASRYVFIAGGVGITPIMSMLDTLAERADDRPLTLLYGVPDLDSMTFRERLDDLAEKGVVDLVPVLQNPPDGWEGERGFVTADVIARHVDVQAPDTEFFVCGPEPMMKAVSAALRDLHVHPSQIRYEKFGLV